jgi:hypothetical protein
MNPVKDENVNAVLSNSSSNKVASKQGFEMIDEKDISMKSILRSCHRGWPLPNFLFFKKKSKNYL